MIRNVCKEDIQTLSKLLDKQLKPEDIDFDLSMIDEENGETQSVFLVGVCRIPYEIGAEDDDDFDYNEVLGVYTKNAEDESLSHTYNEVCAATHNLSYTMFWLPWTEENAKLLAPAFVENDEDGIKYLFSITYSNEVSKYKADSPKNIE